MPPTLDLSRTYSYSDMLHAPSPRLSLRKAGAHSKEDRGPLSSTSSRFSFHHLIASPPPSPSLPALIPRHGKPIPKHKPRTYIRGFLWVAGVLTILYYGSAVLGRERGIPAVGWATHSGEQYEMVGDSELPNFPTPVVVTDKRGRSKWTVSIPPDHTFPLAPKQYADICLQNQEVSKHVADLHRHMIIEHAAHFDYYHVDGNFMDVAEAEEHGLLPGVKARTSMGKGKEESLVGVDESELVSSPLCQKTMTFVLESHDAGFGKTLMQLWTAYGLAKREGREFFIDDSRWAYGKYTSYFNTPPVPTCRPPPRHRMLPCPHQASHLIVSAATVPYTFGGAFNDHFEDPKKMDVHRLKPIYSLARVGYEALFKLQSEDAAYVQHRLAELTKQVSRSMGMPGEEHGDMDMDETKGIIVGIHVRHGDRHPYEFQYKDSYIPHDVYLDEAREQLYKSFGTAGKNGTEDLMSEMKSVFIVASDDPDVYSSPEFSHTSRAQDRIKLASKPPPSPPAALVSPRKFVEENVGWEGGFFAAMFWSLGRPNGAPAVITDGESQTKLPVSEETMRLRELVGRAYLLDLAVLGGCDSIVCTVSSATCRNLGVMMGWNKMVGKQGKGLIDQDGAWRNVDGKGFSWRGVDW